MACLVQSTLLKKKKKNVSFRKVSLLYTIPIARWHCEPCGHTRLHEASVIKFINGSQTRNVSAALALLKT